MVFQFFFALVVLLTLLFRGHDIRLPKKSGTGGRVTSKMAADRRAACVNEVRSLLRQRLHLCGAAGESSTRITLDQLGLALLRTTDLSLVANRSEMDMPAHARSSRVHDALGFRRMVAELATRSVASRNWSLLGKMLFCLIIQS